MLTFWDCSSLPFLDSLRDAASVAMTGGGGLRMSLGLSGPVCGESPPLICCSLRGGITVMSIWGWRRSGVAKRGANSGGALASLPCQLYAWIQSFSTSFSSPVFVKQALGYGSTQSPF